MADTNTTPRAKKATKKTTKSSTRSPAKKSTQQVIARRSTGTSRGTLSDGLATAAAYASAGKDLGRRAATSATQSAKKYGKAISETVRNNPKVASAIVAGLVSVGAALLVKRINREQSPARLTHDLAEKAQRATAALASQAAEVSHQITSRFKR